jgi:hypothetical protein
MGVGAYTGADQPTVPADDGWAGPVEDKPVPPGTPAPPPPPLSGIVRVFWILVVVFVAAVVVIAMLAFVVPAQYSEHQTVTLDNELGWHQSVCVPDQGDFGSVTTNVSFTWSTPSASPILLQASYTFWPVGSFAPGNLVVYNGTGTSGSGWYTSGPFPGNDGIEFFDALAVSGPLVSPVTVDLSYSLPGHYLGGPTTLPYSCGN